MSTTHLHCGQEVVVGGMHTGAGWNSIWNQAIDVFTMFSEADFRLGLNAEQTTLGAVSQLVSATLRRSIQ